MRQFGIDFCRVGVVRGEVFNLRFRSSISALCLSSSLSWDNDIIMMS